MHVWVFMALITTLVLCTRCQDSLLSQCVGYLSYSRLLDLKAEESRVLKHVKPPRYGEASGKPGALSRVRTQASGALAHGFTPLHRRGRLFSATTSMTDCGVRVVHRITRYLNF